HIRIILDRLADARECGVDIEQAGPHQPTLVPHRAAPAWPPSAAPSIRVKPPCNATIRLLESTTDHCIVKAKRIVPHGRRDDQRQETRWFRHYGLTGKSIRPTGCRGRSGAFSL